MKFGIVFGASGLLGPIWVKALAQKSDIVYCVGLGVKKDPELKEINEKNPGKYVLIEQDLLKPIQEINNVKFDFGIFSAATDSVPALSSVNELGKFSLGSWEPFINNQKIFINCLDFFCSNRSAESYGVVIGSMYTTSLPQNKNYVNENGELKFIKHPGYSSSKVAIKNIMQQYAVDFAKNSLVLNMLSPGVVTNNHPDWFIKNIIRHIPNQKFIDKIELIDSVDFLTSKGARHLVGQELLLDGGYNLW
jgi:NAD(P)-dependent dehydrogenase (short-subunit alcohol dehydrogenase family)